MKSPKTIYCRGPSLYFGAHVLFFLLALFSLPLFQMAQFADDPGLGWHIATGEWILSNNSIPEQDPFLYSKSPRPWVCDQWLSDILLFGGYSLGSWPLLYASMSVIFALSFFLPLPCVLRGQLKESGQSFHHPLALSFASVVGFKLSQIHFILRPVIFNLPFFVAVYLALHLLQTAETAAQFSKRLKRLFIVLPILFVFWVNIHGAFFLGLLLLALFCVSSALDLLLNFSKIPWLSCRIFFRLVGLFFLCLGASLLNPYGAIIHKNIFKYTSNQYFMDLMGEWQGLSFANFEGQLYLLALVFLLTAFLLLGCSKQKKLAYFQRYAELNNAGASFFEVISVAAFAYLSLDAVRILPFFAIVLIVPLARAFTLLAILLAPFLKKYLSQTYPLLEELVQREVFARGLVLIPTLVSLGVILFSLAFKSMPLYQGVYGPNPDLYPEAALEYLLEKQSSSGELAVVAAHPDWGGYITFFSNGKAKALIDDRNRMLGQSFYEDYFSAFSKSETLAAALRELGAGYLLLSKSEPITKVVAVSKDFEEIFRKDSAVLFRIF